MIDTLETEAGQRHYRLLVTEYTAENTAAMIARLTCLMDMAGIPYEDFESRVAYAIGYYQSVQEMRQCSNQL